MIAWEAASVGKACSGNTYNNPFSRGRQRPGIGVAARVSGTPTTQDRTLTTSRFA